MQKEMRIGEAKWRVGASIPLPTACEAVALPFELTPQNHQSVPRLVPVCRVAPAGETQRLHRTVTARTTGEREASRAAAKVTAKIIRN